MPMHRFQVSDPAAFLEIAELIFRSSRAGESVAIELPLGRVCRRSDQLAN